MENENNSTCYLKQQAIKKLNSLVFDKTKFIIPETERLKEKYYRQCSSGVVYRHKIDIKGSCYGYY